MSESTTDNFWSAWAQPQEQSVSVFYRLYHDEQGYPLFYSMEDLPGNYIDIDQETYAQASSKVRVINGKLTKNNRSVTAKLTPSDHGTACCPDNVCIVVAEDQPHTKWSLKKND